VYGVSQQAGVNSFKTFSVPLQQGAGGSPSPGAFFFVLGASLSIGVFAS
jgi:hypothetical protein